MRVRRISLAEFRKFRQLAMLDGLEAGINIIEGPNEAGKSTFTAALRAAFLERYGTSAVADFAPYGSNGAQPSVTVEFEHAGHDYVLRKQFLTRSRCELLIDGGTQHLDGDAAEQVLAQLFGYGLSARGLSKAEYAGLPGLLWVAQGEAQEITVAAAHAGQYLRDALTQITGELTSIDSDRLYQRVQAERAALLDARNAKPRGAYKTALQTAADLAIERQALVSAKAGLDADVDRLAQLRSDHEQAEREMPWQAFEVHAARARARLGELVREREVLEQLRRDCEQARTTADLLTEQMARDHADADTLMRQTYAAEQAMQAAEQAELARHQAQVLHDQASAQRDNAHQALRMLERAEQARELDACIERSSNEAARLTASLREAQAQSAQIDILQTRFEQVRIDLDEVQALRATQQLVDRLRAQRDVAATRLTYDLPKELQIFVDDTILLGQGEQLLWSPVELRLPHGGRLHILPGGGRDLSSLTQALADAEATFQLKLIRCGVATLEAAESRLVQAEQIDRELLHLRAVIQARAPQGLSSVATELTSLQDMLARQQAQRAALGSHDFRNLDTFLGQAQGAMAQAEAAWQQADQVWRAACAASDQARERATWMRVQAETRRAAFEAIEAGERRSARAEQLLAVRARVATLTDQAKRAAAALYAQQPDLIEQDMQRYTQSAQAMRQAHQARYADLLQLQGRLEQAGAQGLGERLAQIDAQWQRWTRRCNELAQQAQALDLLWRVLSERREQATQRLLAPLTQRMAHYLDLLFPGAQLRLDETLRPVGLTRNAYEDALAALSFGTREQLGLLARLAYADLLQAAGRPTLIVLDDALVHADAARRARMKRALFDAGTRHQILLFTCHPEAWQDLGVRSRSLHAMT